ncbi:MAG: ABC transporter ATP-binding protein [Lachnospiraceae bacterium]|nr:ABC transporter ATP-binding protein [Lachnospiraceae bacterium]
MHLEVKDLHVTLGRTRIVKGVNLKVEDGQSVGIIGPNGCGKSTLLKAIYRVNPTEKGKVLIDGKSMACMTPKEVAKKIAVVGQFNELSFDFSVEDMVLMGRSPHKKMMETFSEEDYCIVDDALEKTELKGLRDRSYLSLSGGEKQRVILARAIAQRPKLLILDEPTNHLDVKFQFEVLDLVKSLGISTLCVLHDIELSARYCDYLYALKAGKVVNEGTPKKLLTRETIHTLYEVESEIYNNPITGALSVAYLPGREAV